MLLCSSNPSVVRAVDRSRKMPARSSSSTRKWTPPTVHKTFSISGGFLTRPMPIDTRSVSCDDAKSPAVASDTAEHFVKIEKNADWMIKAVGGMRAQRGSLSRTKLVEELKTQMKRLGASPPQPSAVEDVDYTDPMSALDPLDIDMKPTPKKCKRPRKGLVIEIDMPLCEPSRHPDCASRKTVRVLGFSTNQVWLALADVPWLIQWLVDSVSTSGVPMLHDAVLTANSPAVAGVNFQWDFEDSWEATILVGPNPGSTIVSSVSDFAEAKWAVVAPVHNYGVSFADSTYAQKKTATLHYLEYRCTQLLESS